MPYYDATIRCGYCGKFTCPEDWYTPWGCANYEQPEPYDPVPLCKRCARKRYEAFLADMLKRGIPVVANRPEYQCSGAWFDAKIMARFLFRVGLAERPIRHEVARSEVRNTLVVPECLTCKRPLRHPAHDWPPRPDVKIKWCKFAPCVTHNLGKAQRRTWCSCGWDSGWVDVKRGDPWSVNYHSALSAHHESVGVTPESRPLAVSA